MRNTTKLFGIIAIVAVIGLSFASCGDNGGGGGSVGELLADGVIVDLNLEGTNLVAAAVAHANSNPGDGPFVLRLRSNLMVDATATIGAGVHLTVEGIGGRRRITRTGQGNLFNINGANRSLTLDDYITLAGTAGNNVVLVHVAGGASLTMNAGAQITRNTSAVQAGGVNVTGAASTFTMNGGEIYRNTTTGVGSGGGLRVAGGATFVMHEGAVIRDNTTTGNNSGGVYISGATSIFRMLGGEIRGNESTGAGVNGAAGGVHIDNGALQIVNGVIFGGEEEDYPNTGTTNDALLVVDGTATLGTMVGGVFTPANPAVTLDSDDTTIRVANGVRLTN